MVVVAPGRSAVAATTTTTAAAASASSLSYGRIYHAK